MVDETVEIMSKEAEAESLRSELGMAIVSKAHIPQAQYRRAKELDLIPALKHMAELCEIDLMDLVK